MPRTRLLSLLACLSLLLAGCLGTEPEPAPVAVEPSGQELLDGEVDPESIAEDSNVSEFAKALEEKYHYHDLWRGSLTKVLFDGEVRAASMAPLESPTSDEFFVSIFRTVFSPFGANPTIIELPEGTLVPPETEFVDVTVTWAASPTITGLRLFYRDALSRNGTFVDGGLESGKTLRLPTTLAANDMPHTAVSKWLFALMPHSERGPGVFNGTVQVKIEAHRPDVLFLAPPHPDYWGDETQKVFLQQEVKARRTQVGFFGVPGQTEGFGFFALPNGTIVPPHTRLLTVTLDYENTDPKTASMNPRPAFAYSHANTRGLFFPDPSRVEPGKVIYHIEMTSKMADSPYANESQWRLLVYLDSDSPTAQVSRFAQVASFEGSYTITILGERENL
ncbi:MAG TPA: hypothetical protein VM681_09800 [Candidatus Thermoplasmatota archaeon]|nr:hypothetical protein [Candidatus Thermoplasmatota archaeon]